MKSVKKLLQKAIVFTLAVSMVAGPSMTVSAAGLSDLYQIEDGWGNVTGNKDNTRTGTVTATQSNSGILAASAMLEGIQLVESDFQFELPRDAEGDTLKAFLDWGEDVTLTAEEKALNDDLLKRLQWRSSNTEVVTVKVPNKSYNGGSRDQIQIIPKGAGKATVTVSLDSAQYDIHYTATAKVTVLQYADKLIIDKDALEEDAYSGSFLELDDYVTRQVEVRPNSGIYKDAPTSDELSFAVVCDKKAGTYKNGVLTLKTAKAEMKVTAIGKYAKSDEVTFTTKQGTNATAIKFSDDKKFVSKNKLAWIINNGLDDTITAEVTKVKQKDNSSAKKCTECTDKVTWSSANPSIIAIDGDTKATKFDSGKNSVKLVAKSAGKTQIIAAVSSGKSFKLNATVSGNLDKIVIEPATMQAYSGQTIELYDMADQYFTLDETKNFMDAGLKWSLDNPSKEQKQSAKITKTGTLTIQPNIQAKEIKVKAEPAKAKGNSTSATLTLTLQQINVKKITVSRGNKDVWEPVTLTVDPSNGKATQSNKKALDEINVGGTRTYTLAAEATYKDENDKDVPLSDEEARDALGWSASGNRKTIIASRGKNGVGILKALKKGNATITVSSSAWNGKKYVPVKLTFKDTVKAPTKNLTLTAKNSGIPATDKSANFAIKAVMDKGSTTKTKDLTWTAYEVNEKGKQVTGGIAFDSKDYLKNGKITYAFKSADAGKRIKVTASVNKSNVKASIYLDVVMPNKKVTFDNGEGSTALDAKGKTLSLSKTAPNNVASVKVNVELKDSDVNSGAKVTYTVSNPGVAFVLQNRDDKYNITVYGISTGTTKITATTSDGKKAVLTVKVQ